MDAALRPMANGGVAVQVRLGAVRLELSSGESFLLAPLDGDMAFRLVPVPLAQVSGA